MKFHTNLPPSECLKRLEKPIENSPGDMKKAIRRKYGSYFSKTPDICEQRVRWDRFLVYEVSIWNRRIYTYVDTDKFEVSVVNSDRRKVPVVNGDKCSNRYSNKKGYGSQTKFSGTIVENEDGGSTVDFRITRCDSCMLIGFFLIVLLITIIVMLVGGIVEHQPLSHYYAVAKMGLAGLFFLPCGLLPFYIMEVKSRRLVVEFIKDLLEINDINKQQVTGRLRKMPKQK